MKHKRFSTWLLDDSLKEKKKANEKRRENSLNSIFLILDLLSKKIDFEKVYIFGSLAKTGLFSKSSDIDIGFFGLDSKNVIKAATFISRKIGLDVDVLQLEGHRLANKIIKEGIKWEKKR